MSFAIENKINEERFNSYVEKGDAVSCWNWCGNRDKKGYGRFHIGKSRASNMLAHRIAFGLANGYLPEAVCHSCDNPSCCNPAHLVGADRDWNNKDMKNKRRHFLHVDPSLSLKGERHGMAKINDAIVKEIKREYSQGGVTQRALAAKYGVCQRTVAKVINNQGWIHVAEVKR